MFFFVLFLVGFFVALWWVFGVFLAPFSTPFLSFLMTFFDVFPDLRKRVFPGRFWEVFGVRFPMELYVLHKEYLCFVKMRFWGFGVLLVQKRVPNRAFWGTFGDFLEVFFDTFFDVFFGVVF